MPKSKKQDIPNNAYNGVIPQKAPNLKDLEQQIPEEVKKEIEKTRQKLQQVKKQLLKKFSYIDTVSILPPWAARDIEEDENIVKENPKENYVHLLILLPDDKFKEINNVKAEAIKLVKDFAPKIWVSVRTRASVWDCCLDGKYPLVDGIALSFPLHDKEGFLASLRLATIHKRMCLGKFERYVTSYVIAGSLVRGNAKKTSDVDVYIVIDDTDVKRMSRYELRDKLRAIIWNYAIQAGEEAGIKNKLNVQIYILTDFWEAVKDAHPVIFTLIRDGVPLFDKGAFMPWKLLLKMGKIKPSPEAIDLFMSMGEKVSENVKRKLTDIVLEDIWWGVITPSQAVLMLYGLAPPTHKETAKVMRDVLVKKEKLLEEKYVKILEKIVKTYSTYEHDFAYRVTGKQIDEFLADVTDYIARLKKLMKQIEEKIADKNVKEQFKQVLDLITHITGKVPKTKIAEKFKKELIDKKKIAPRNLRLLQEINEVVKKSIAKKATKHDLARLRRSTYELSSALLEYIQRKEHLAVQKSKTDIVYITKVNGKNVKKQGQLFIFDKAAFVIPDINQSEIKKIVGKSVTNSDQTELKKYLAKPTYKKITPELISALKNLFKEFEIIF
ncbi:MAG: nucleotidyltransferase domain-containing protein [archaeon]|nr:MAG: nucleotidyltransferase domain-containing protein [archaeon]